MEGNKRILLVSSAFFPEISPRSFRATELAKEFYRQGHDVTVMSKYRDYDYSEFLSQYQIKFKMWGKNKFPEFPVFSKKPFSYFSRAFSRLLSVLFEYPAIEEMFKIKRRLVNEKSTYDFMISFAVPFPVHWGVARARSPKNPISNVWVADCGDSYMLGRLDRFKKPFYFKRFEIDFCLKCDFITIPFDNLKNQFYPDFRSKILVIPQGFDFSEIKLFEGEPKNEKPLFIFAGSIIPDKRDLTMFINFLATLRTDFLFVVYTNQKEWFMKFKDSMGGRMELREYIDRISLIYELSKADFLVNIDTVFDSQSNTEAIPSKLIDYALADRPILNINSAFLDEDLVLDFFKTNYKRQRIVEKSQFEISKVAAKFIELIE